MENLLLEQTEETPYILADYINNSIKIVGQSYPENTFDFYKVVISWMEEYFSQQREVEVYIDLEYLNSSSLKAYFDIFDIFEKSFETKKSKINIKWMYHKENDIALETGEDFQLDFENLNIEIIEKVEG